MNEPRTRTAPDVDGRHLPLAAGLLIFAPLCLLGNQIGSALRYPEIGAAVFFLPYAFLTAALLVSPPRHWAWYILTGSVAHLATHWPAWSLSWVLFADVANIARALTAAIMLRWFFGGPPRLDSIRALSLFVVCAVLAAPAVGATIGAANVVFHGASLTYGPPWLAWFVSNALTGLASLPALIAAFVHVGGARRVRIERARVAEALLLGGALIVTCAVSFGLIVEGRYLALSLYAPLPALMWAALRFGSSGASVALTIVAFAAIWGVDGGIGPLLASSPDDNILMLQVFVLLTTVPILCLAVIGSARNAVVQLHRSLLASIQDQVAVLDARGVVIEVNDAWRRSADIAGAPTVHGAGPGADYLAVCRLAVVDGDTIAASVLAGVTKVLTRAPRQVEIEYEHEHDGRREAYILNVEALERSDGGAVLTRTNVTARREAQVEIDQQRRELSHLARVAVLGQLSGAFAHELQQPLTSIMCNAETARHLLRRDPPSVNDIAAILDDIVADDHRAAEVIHRLRALLKRGDSHLQPLDASELVGDVLELARAELLTRRVAVTSQVEPGLPPLLGDKVQLQQVLLNLILNACEAMGTTTAADRRLCLTADADSGANVHLAVRDSGIGIPPALIDRLFEPFVTTKPEGLGLGLSISRTIVAAHGGRLWAENNPHGGATMHCLLSMADRQPRSATARPLEEAHT
jgi:signal transduction histidine kinase/integral membrane sensor domain MASE1